MHTRPKRDMPVGRPLDIESVRVGELGGISIGCPQEGQDQLPFADRLPVDGYVFFGNTPISLEGGVITQALFDRTFDQGRVLSQLSQLIGVLEQEENGVGNETGLWLYVRPPEA